MLNLSKQKFKISKIVLQLLYVKILVLAAKETAMLTCKLT